MKTKKKRIVENKMNKGGNQVSDKKKTQTQSKSKNKDGKKKSGGGKFALGALLLLLLGGGAGIGLGGFGENGLNGFGLFETSSTPETAEVKDNENAAADPSEKETEDIGESKAENSDIVTVTIRENQVFVGEKEFTDAQGLKTYIEEINNDARTFRIKEENAIQATYEWVTGVFDELKIQVLPSETEGASVDGIQ